MVVVWSLTTTDEGWMFHLLCIDAVIAVVVVVVVNAADRLCVLAKLSPVQK
jgi:uncharacterized membrane-anchored protein